MIAMKIRNTKIGTQLKIGFVVIIVFIIIMAVNAYMQDNQLYQQTETMYQHPLQVRVAIDALDNDALTMSLNLRDLILSKNDQEKQNISKQIAISDNDFEQQFIIVRQQYLGQPLDVDDAYNNYITWKASFDENENLILAGDVQTANINIKDGGKTSLLRDTMMASIKTINGFANKAESLYSDSANLKSALNLQLIIMTLSIILLMFLIGYFVLRNIKKPLDQMNETIIKFNDGDLYSRSNYKLENEFGILSDSLNKLADQVQENANIDEKTAKLIEVMLGEEDAKKFFRSTLAMLVKQTDSQMAAVYLLSENQKMLEYFESIGVDESAKQSFDIESLEGAFGAAIFEGTIQHVKNISDDSRFVFTTVTGKFIPKEMITIPILSGRRVIAVISLVTISKFASNTSELIEKISGTMSTRIEGILAYKKIKEFSDMLEDRNGELDAQKNELSNQANELMQQNVELEVQRNQLHEASQLKTNFLSNMSHELRTPLNSVIALTGVLNRRLEKKISEEEYSYLEIIERNGKNLLLLINDILDISRIEAGHEEISITNFNANSLIDDVTGMIKPQADQKNIQILHEFLESEIHISSDPDKIRHIMQNLITNAVKFTEKGQVVITTKKNKNNIEIMVKDTGIGISEEYLPHIFDEFRQADGSTSRRFGGAGLGLAIAKKYASLLGGTISVTSVPDEGSEFILTLPLTYMPGNKAIEENEIEENDIEYHNKIVQKVESPPDIADKTILLIEDNESAIIQIKDLVEETGCKVKIASNANDAFKIIDESVPDAIVLDLMMPVMDGFEVLGIIRNAECTVDIPVLVLTAKHITKEELKYLKQNNVHQLIQKGDVNRIQLQNSIKSILAPSVPEAKKEQKQLPNFKGKPKVLVVEDNADNMTTIRALFGDEFNIIEAVDGKQAVKMAEENVPDLIIMDIALPEMTGIEAFKIIREQPKLHHIPVIALTASAMTQDREAILSHGFDAYIPKPIIVEQFKKVIGEVLYGR
jgi:signal transduction histidine kinase/DNA-binding response OmpR family regulator